VADQSGYNAAPIRAIDRINRDVGVGKHV
jgi:hypothetical protein